MISNTPPNQNTPLSIELIKSQPQFSHLSDEEAATVLDSIVTFSEILFVFIQNNPTFAIDNDTLTINKLNAKTNKKSNFKDAA